MSIDVHGQDRIAMSQRERDLLKVMGPVLQGQRTQGEAARLAGLSVRQIRRIQRKLEGSGDAAFDDAFKVVSVPAEFVRGVFDDAALRQNVTALKGPNFNLSGRCGSLRRWFHLHLSQHMTLGCRHLSQHPLRSS